MIGISATHPKWKKWRQVIITEDKDLQTIPGEVFFPKSDELLKVSPDEAELHFYCQALAGDRVGNFPGARGLGVQGGARKSWAVGARGIETTERPQRAPRKRARPRPPGRDPDGHLLGCHREPLRAQRPHRRGRRDPPGAARLILQLRTTTSRREKGETLGADFEGLTPCNCLLARGRMPDIMWKTKWRWRGTLPAPRPTS